MMDVLHKGSATRESVANANAWSSNPVHAGFPSGRTLGKSGRNVHVLVGMPLKHSQTA